MAEPRSVGITIIAVGKMLKAIVLLAVGVTALVMAGKDPPELLGHWADVLRVDRENRIVHRAITAISGVNARKLEEIGVGTFVYALLFSVEGIGLWLKKVWAEYFTLGITLSFIPLEIYELVKRPGAGKIVTLVLNVAAVVYLVVRVVQRSRKKRRSPASRSRSEGYARPSGLLSPTERL